MHIDCIVIGAGVVGLAIARSLAVAGRDVVVIERAARIGEETSSRNSGVVHAGLYYPTGSNKAGFCVEGRKLLYRFCEDFSVPFKQTGKLIVATKQSQLDILHQLAKQGKINGVDDLVWMDAGEAQKLEPELTCIAALHSPSTGIVDSHQLMLALQGDAERSGMSLALNTEVVGISPSDNGLIVQTQGDQDFKLSCSCLINAAGHGAVQLAALLNYGADYRPPKAYLAKGSYFGLNCNSPFNNLIYPVPEPGGLGIHLTLDLAGRARFGPDVEWVDNFDYDVDPFKTHDFQTAIRRYWKGLPDGSLVADYSGIRPKIADRFELAADFRIDTSQEHGIEGLMHLFGIESPGLTSALAIAEHVLQSVENER
ncbi:MAG: NAD(P)/FAD-dependent oxidoreductase [Cohaesibacteraceae bacterium]|nr:NAD(P)/FAD-dependent oxidoreductase [Cohaesibacteraceae bacterium]